MYPTSQKYKDNIYAPARSTYGQVTFDISDTTAAGDVTSIATTTEASISNKAQLINKKRDATYKLATLETNRFKLDGSFSFPDDTIANNGEMGFCSSGLCEPASNNLLPPFTYWALVASTIVSSYQLRHDATAGIQRNTSPLIPVILGTTYTLSCIVNATGGTGYIVFVKYDSAGVMIAEATYTATATATNTRLNVSYTVEAGVSYIGVHFYSNAAGTFYFIDPQLELGSVATPFKTGDRMFLTRPQITFNFGATHSSLGLTITFDKASNEYATDFNISVYDAANALITSVDVVGNTNVTSTPTGQLLNYKKVVLTIKKWSVGDRRARVLEVDFGIVRIYTDDNLISMSLIEQMDLMTAVMPSTEFKFVVDNSDRAFNILNPTGFYKYLQQKQQVIAEIGLDVGGGLIEYIPLGNYLLWEWRSDEGSLTATFTARTNLDLMVSFDYENLVSTATNLYDFAVSMFTLCGITNYSIDAGLSSIATNKLVKKTNCKNILQMIAIAGCANVYVTRSNVITIKASPAAIGAAVDTISLDDMYQEARIDLDKTVKQVIVNYWTDLATSAPITVTSSATLGDTLKLDSNTLINSSARATAVANWILAQKGNRAIYQANWRGNPAQELADAISLENTYGANMKAYVTKNEIDYAGYLSAKTEARGVPN